MCVLCIESVSGLFMWGGACVCERAVYHRSGVTRLDGTGQRRTSWRPTPDLGKRVNLDALYALWVLTSPQY